MAGSCACLRGATDARGSCAPVVRTEFPIQRETRGEPYLRAGRLKGGPGPAIVSTTSSSGAERTISITLNGRRIMIHCTNGETCSFHYCMFMYRSKISHFSSYFPKKVGFEG